MQNEKSSTKDNIDACIIRRSTHSEIIEAHGTYYVKCFDADGKLKWEDTIDNVVTTVGKNLALDTYLAGSAYTVTGPYMGLISSVGYTSPGTPFVGTGVINGYVMNITGYTSGTMVIGQLVTGTGVTAGTYVTGLGTNPNNSTGTATVNLSQTVSSTTLTCTGVGTLATDTMSSHGDWTEAGNANAPSYTAPRPTCAWSGAASGSKALSAPLAFAITSSGTVKGCFIVFGSGAVSTIDNTSGTLYSAGLFTGGDKATVATDTISVSYTASL